MAGSGERRVMDDGGGGGGGAACTSPPPRVVFDARCHVKLSLTISLVQSFFFLYYLHILNFNV